jgi:hypothetical protein
LKKTNCIESVRKESNDASEHRAYSVFRTCQCQAVILTRLHTKSEQQRLTLPHTIDDNPGTEFRLRDSVHKLQIFCS